MNCRKYNYFSSSLFERREHEIKKNQNLLLLYVILLKSLVYINNC